MTEPDLSYIHPDLRATALPIGSLTPDPKNARKHDRQNLDAIKTSLEKFGFRQPIIVQKQGMIVRAGNGRLEVALELGWTHVPALVVDETESEAVAYAIADNRTAELAEWDFGNLTDMLEELRNSSDDSLLDAIGFDDESINFLLEQANAASAEISLDKRLNNSEEGQSASKELSLEDFGTDNFAHVCPRCQFGFNEKKGS